MSSQVPGHASFEQWHSFCSRANVFWAFGWNSLLSAARGARGCYFRVCWKHDRGFTCNNFGWRPYTPSRMKSCVQDTTLLRWCVSVLPLGSGPGWLPQEMLLPPPWPPSLSSVLISKGPCFHPATPSGLEMLLTHLVNASVYCSHCLLSPAPGM